MAAAGFSVGWVTAARIQTNAATQPHGSYNQAIKTSRRSDTPLYVTVEQKDLLDLAGNATMVSGFIALAAAATLGAMQDIESGKRRRAQPPTCDREING